MLKLFLGLLVSLTPIFGANNLGVLYSNTTTNNVVSPSVLTFPNARLQDGTASKSVALNAAQKLVTTLLSLDQQNILNQWVSGTNTLRLGSAKIIAGDTPPTNGTTYVDRILYINSNGTNLNDTYWGNYGTNWYAIASTNGGSITENQLNFSNNTTANATTNRHGLLPILNGINTDFLDGTGNFNNPLIANLSGIAPGSILNSTGPGPGSTGVNGGAMTTEVGNVIRVVGAGFGQNGSLRAHDLYATNKVNANVIYGNAVVVSNVAASSLLRLNSTNGVSAVTIGSGISFDGTTLSASGGGGGIGTSGSPTATQLAYFTSPTAVSGVPSSSVSIAGVSVPTLTTTTSLNINANDTVGNVRSGTYTPTVTVQYYCSTIGASQRECFFTRIGNIVHVQGRVQVSRSGSPTGAGIPANQIEFYIDLPVSSAIGGDPSGVQGTAWVTNESGNTVNDIGMALIYGYNPSVGVGKAYFRASGSSTTGTTRNFNFSFTYSVN